ncbi:MAG: hypothetical protein Q4P16_02975 [Spirochaetales bacterium]|nr:hypothetical protein [Spirochaetales bacterium]
MSTTYQIKTEFSILDKASPALSTLGKKGQWLEKNLSAPLLAAEKRFTAFETAMKQAVVGGFGAVVTAAAVAVKSAIPLGMELEQNLGGTEAVFGEYAESVQTLAETAYKNMGLSASDYMATANKMGSLFQGSGLEQVRAMELSTQAMQRAADVASVMGIDTSMAMESIAGAAKGNFTMMDNLGVAMNATTLSAYALEKGINFKWNTASNAEKAELAMQMFFERTEQYAGNFAREADSTLAGSFGRMKTNIQDILAKMALGQDIKPSLENLQESVLAFAHNIVPAVVAILNQLPDLVSGVLSAIGPVIEQALGDIRSPFGEILIAGLKVIKMIWDLKVPILTIGGLFMAWHGIVDVIFMITKAMKVWEIGTRVLEGIQAAHNAVLWGTTVAIEAQGGAAVAAGIGMKLYAVGAGIASAATSAFSTAMGFLNAVFVASPIGWIVLAIVAAIGLLVGIIVICVKHWDSISAALKRFGEAALNILSTVWNAITGFFSRIPQFLSDVWNAITGFFTNMYHAVMKFLFGDNAAAMEEFVAQMIEKIGAFFAGIWESITSFFSGLWESLSAFFVMVGEGIAGFFTGIWEKITGAFTAVIESIGAFFCTIWEKVTGFFAMIGATVAGWVESLKANLQPLFDFISGLFGGIANLWQGLVSVFQSEGLIGVFKRIGSAILGFVLTPIEAVLRALDWVPGIGDTMGSWADKIAEMKSGFDANASFTENQNLQISPTKTAAVASSYSRQENFSNVNISLAEQLKSDNYGMVAPGVTVARTASGSF